MAIHGGWLATPYTPLDQSLYPYFDHYLINHYKPDAVRIGIANALKLIFHLSLCSMIAELHL